MPPEKPGPRLYVVIRPPGREPYALSLDRLTLHVRAARLAMGISRDELRKKRLAAMGVVGAQMDASAAMYDELTEYSKKVEDARQQARAAHIGALDAEISDLKEMAEEMADFAQAVPKNDVGRVSPPVTPKPATGTAALAALMSTQPNPPAEKFTVQPDEVGNGDAYVGTSPPNH